MKTKLLVASILALANTAFVSSAMAGATCKDLPKAFELRKLFVQVTGTPGTFPNGGRGHHGWLTLMDSQGVVCAVVNSMSNSGDVTTDMSGIGHREQSAKKANTSVAFSNNEVALASGNLYVPSMPGGQLFNTILASLDSKEINGNPGEIHKWGTANDPMVGKVVGGYLPLAGGLPLYDKNKKKVGAIGVSGDTYCTSHVVAWKIREKLRNGAYTVANVPGGVANGYTNDALIQDIAPANAPGSAAYSPSGFGFVQCLNNPTNETDGGSIDGN
jgi:uncharacterized protein GlcG (DUF336 family)